MVRFLTAARYLGLFGFMLALWISDDINDTLKVLALLQIMQILLPLQNQKSKYSTNLLWFRPLLGIYIF
jgi:hypothetical protein